MAWPLVVVLAGAAFDFDRRPSWVVGVFGLSCAATSRAWQPIGQLADGTNLPKVFMNLGPWITFDQYVLQLGALAATSALLWALLVSRRVGEPTQ